MRAFRKEEMEGILAKIKYQLPAEPACSRTELLGRERHKLQNPSGEGE